jgi:hypothetical protein
MMRPELCLDNTVVSSSTQDTILTQDLPRTEDWPAAVAKYDDTDNENEFFDTIPTQDLPRSEDWDLAMAVRGEHAMGSSQITTEEGSEGTIPTQDLPRTEDWLAPLQQRPLQTSKSPSKEEKELHSQDTFRTQDLSRTEDWERFRNTNYEEESPASCSQRTIATQELPSTEDWDHIIPQPLQISNQDESPVREKKFEANGSKAIRLSVSNVNELDSPTSTIVPERHLKINNYSARKHSKQADDKDSKTSASAVLLPIYTNGPASRAHAASPVKCPVVEIPKSISHHSRINNQSTRRFSTSPLSTGTNSTLDSEQSKRTPWFKTKRRKKLTQTTLSF